MGWEWGGGGRKTRLVPITCFETLPGEVDADVDRMSIEMLAFRT